MLLTAALLCVILVLLCVVTIQWDTNKQFKLQLETYKLRIRTLNAAIEKAARDYNQVVTAFHQATGRYPGGDHPGGNA